MPYGTMVHEIIIIATNGTQHNRKFATGTWQPYSSLFSLASCQADWCAGAPWFLSAAVARRQRKSAVHRICVHILKLLLKNMCNKMPVASSEKKSQEKASNEYVAQRKFNLNSNE
jgi:hypothetical protein